MQHLPVYDAPRHTLHQLGVRNRIEGNHDTLPIISTFPNA
jgi:hypothetical protein